MINLIVWPSILSNKRRFAAGAKSWIILTILILTISSNSVKSQNIFVDKSGQIHFSNLDTWYFRSVKESFITGGETIKLYKLGEGDRDGIKSFAIGESPWATSNLHAKLGIDFGMECAFPEKRGNGFCCRMETRKREIHVLGISVNVLVTGAIFLGELLEPVRSSKDPIKNLNHGIPFTNLPKGVRFDYKCSPGENRVNSDKHWKPVPGKDMAEFCFILQKRWEEADGTVSAVRIGGMRSFFSDSGSQWINAATFPIKYGDVTRDPSYDPQRMGLIPSVGPLYVKNSKGVMVPLVEKRWGKAGEIPTHLVMYFSSSYQGIDFIGSPESIFWVDNISLIY